MTKDSTKKKVAKKAIDKRFPPITTIHLTPAEHRLIEKAKKKLGTNNRSEVFREALKKLAA